MARNTAGNPTAFDRLKNALGVSNPAPPERHANPTEAEQDSAMNAGIAHVTAGWNRGSRAKPEAAAAGVENTPAWQRQSAKIAERRTQVKGARILKRLRGGA